MKVKDKKDEPAKVKTRKKGGTGIGAAIKQKLDERKERRKDRKFLKDQRESKVKKGGPFKNYKKGYYGE